MSIRFQLPALSETDYRVFNVRCAPIRIHGLYHPEEEGVFRRMPQEVADKVSTKVSVLCQNPAGGRIRFRTDSSFVAIKVTYENRPYVSRVAAALSVGGRFFFDLYADSRFVAPFFPPMQKAVHDRVVSSFDLTDGMEQRVVLGERKMRDILIHFPSHAYVKNVWIALDADAVLESPAPYRNELPIVFYGSSITQGSCAQRAGNSYENILSRRLNLDFCNLGFSSGCKAEEEMMRYLADLPMSAFVYDYDHNSKDADALRESHLRGLRIFREKNPDLPVLLLSRPNLCGGEEMTKRRIEVILDTLRYFTDRGDRNLYFVSGQDMLFRHDPEMMTADGTHPNDFGFFCMAEAIQPVLEQIFPK